MKVNQFEKLTKFLDRLEEHDIFFELKRSRDAGVSVHVAVPGQRWEVDFLDDGTVDVERFVSDGGVQDESVLETLFSEFSNRRDVVPEHNVAT